MELQFNGFVFSDEKDKLQIERICALLKTTYWAGERSRETIEKSILHSLCFGIYKDGEQVGFARCVTDYAVMFWLADVIIDERARGQGLGKKLIQIIVEHPLLQGLTALLATRDAQGLYARHGFESVDARYYKKRPAQLPQQTALYEAART